MRRRGEREEEEEEEKRMRRRRAPGEGCRRRRRCCLATDELWLQEPLATLLNCSLIVTPGNGSLNSSVLIGFWKKKSLDEKYVPSMQCLILKSQLDMELI